jgi:hypothetical protein
MLLPHTKDEPVHVLKARLITPENEAYMSSNSHLVMIVV